MTGDALDIRRLFLDVDKAVHRPSLIEVAEAIMRCAGVSACNITVGEIDVETIGTGITIKGERMNYDEIEQAIERTGAVVHSMDQIVAGSRLIEHVPRSR